MANLRRTKLKAKRIGCNVSKVDKCTTKEEVEDLINKLTNSHQSTLKEDQKNELSE